MFALRQALWGKIALRRRLPVPAAGNAGELAFYRMVLERALAAEVSESVDLVLDVGCRNWSYAPAVAEAFPHAELLGVELDGGRRYWNLHRRFDYARAQAAELVFEGRLARAVHADFRDVDLATALIAAEKIAFCFFFPFVSERPCRKWGLPARFSDFGALVRHAAAGCRLSDTGAFLLSCHQGEWEAEIAREAYRGLAPRELVLKAHEFAGLWPSLHDVHVLSARLE